MERKIYRPVQNIRVLPCQSSKHVWSFNKILYFFQRFPCLRPPWAQIEHSMVASLLNGFEFWMQTMKHLTEHGHLMLPYSIGVKGEDLVQGVVKPVGVVTRVKVKEVQSQGWVLKEDKHHSISEYQNMALKTSKFNDSYMVQNVPNTKKINQGWFCSLLLESWVWFLGCLSDTSRVWIKSKDIFEVGSPFFLPPQSL